MQSMLFDSNTATPAHQDWYYLDSIPNGHLLAGWFALEDIHEGAGRFYVLPESNRHDFDLSHEEQISNAPYMVKLNQYVDNNSHRIYAPALQKGDVLFWNSATVHGSKETLDPKYSRKSLTAHYLPSEYQFGNRYQDTPYPNISYQVFNGMNYKVVSDLRKKFSWPTKLRTDFRNYVWNKPQLQKIKNSVMSFYK